MQSTPRREFFSVTCRDLISARLAMGERPEFSARAMGIASRASAKALMAYCSKPGVFKTLNSMRTGIREIYLDSGVFHGQ
jgi:hypothetical protein